MGFIVEPLALVCVTIAVYEPTMSVGFVVVPVACVFCAVLPDHHASTASTALFVVLTDVDAVVFIFPWQVHIFDLVIWIPGILPHTILNFPNAISG